VNNNITLIHQTNSRIAKMLMSYELAIGTYAINPPSYAHQWAAKGKRLVYMFKKGF
jgi:hypothetical protein